MNGFVLAEYRRLRRKDWPAKDALRAAKIHDVFTDLVNDGLAKLEVEPEDCPYDDSFVDTWTDMRESDRARYKKKLQERVERDGHNCLVAYVLHEDESWESVDSCGGFAGDDWRDSGYDADLKLAVIDHLGLCSDVNLPCFGSPSDECECPDCVVKEVMSS